MTLGPVWLPCLEYPIREWIKVIYFMAVNLQPEHTAVRCEPHVEDLPPPPSDITVESKHQCSLLIRVHDIRLRPLLILRDFNRITLGPCWFTNYLLFFVKFVQLPPSVWERFLSPVPLFQGCHILHLVLREMGIIIVWHYPEFSSPFPHLATLIF